jgi:hypothetical protein
MDEAAAWLVARISSIYGVAAHNIATDSIKEFVSRPHLRALYVQPGSACAKHFEDAPPPDDKAGDAVGGSQRVSLVSFGVVWHFFSLHLFFFFVSIWFLMLSVMHIFLQRQVNFRRTATSLITPSQKSSKFSVGEPLLLSTSFDMTLSKRASIISATNSSRTSTSDPASRAARDEDDDDAVRSFLSSLVLFSCFDCIVLSGRASQRG